jgi:hypothetical protein
MPKLEQKTMSEALPLPDNLARFIASAKWTFAKTMPKWPHEYIVRERVDEELFVQLVQHIRVHGYEGRYFHQRNMYFDHDGRAYWTMGAAVSETTVINRCPKEGTYESRLKSGTLPD